MMLHRIGCGWAILTVLCILTIFFFPATFGPYSTVHGPVTALRAVQLAARLHLAIIQGGLGASGMSWIALFASAKSLVVVHTEFDSAGIADRVTALRC